MLWCTGAQSSYVGSQVLSQLGDVAILCTDAEVLASDETDVESSGGKGLKALALFSGCDSALCALVWLVSVESSESGGDDGRAWDFCRSRDRASLGV